MTVYKRPDSPVYWYEFQVRGKRYRGSTGTTDARQAVKVENAAKQAAKQAAILADIMPPKAAEVPRMLLSEVARQWLSGSAVALRDHRNNESRVRLLFGTRLERQSGLGYVQVQCDGLPQGLYVDEVTTGALVTLKGKRLAAGVAPATVNRELALVQSLMGMASSLGVRMPPEPIKWSDRNRVASLRMAEGNGKLRWLSDLEVSKLLGVLVSRRDAEADNHGVIDAHDLVVMLLDLGCRYDEAASLPWTSVDFSARVVRLHRSKVQNASALPMTEALYAVLRARRDHPEMQGRVFVFPALTGAGNGRHVWTGTDEHRGHATAGIQKAMDDAGLNREAQRLGKVTPHTLRHTYASRLALAGVSLQKIAKLLGHSSVKMTERYAHLCPEDAGREAVAILNQKREGDKLHLSPTNVHTLGVPTVLQAVLS